MLTYMYFGTNDLERAIAFYVAAGWGTYEDDGLRGLAFWIGKPFDGQIATIGNGSMAAFRA